MILAAVPITGGAPIADPFRETTALVNLLGLCAAQLRGLQDRSKSRSKPSRFQLGRARPADAVPHGYLHPAFA